MENISVLIVEDESAVAAALEMRLKRTFKQVYLAVDGEEGLNKAFENKPDVIVTDLRMPRLEGMEMIARIRKTMTDVPIIVLTASCDDLDMQRAEALNVAGYFRKPLMVDDLIKMIRELV
jgi:CheY-like chemotaxis protein